MLTIKPTDIEQDMIFLSGWKSPEHDFIWALGPVSIMNIPLGPASEYRGRNLKFSVELNVPITPSNPQGSRLTFMLGGAVLFDQTVREHTRIIFHAPAATTSPRLNILHITNHNPANIDGMALGYQLYAIEMEELPVLREGDIFTFGRGSLHTAILGSGWKDPEEGFCWSVGTESRLTLSFQEEAYRQEERDGVSVAEIFFSVYLHDRLGLESRHWHILDVVTNHLLLNRQIHPRASGLVMIHAYVPLGSDSIVELRLIDHCATTPALLGNDPNDHTVLGFQLVSLELASIFTLPCAELPAIASLFEPSSPLAIGTRGGGNDG
jgi:hypothetical protein